MPVAGSTASDPHWLAIDQGGHASRALLFDAQGQVVDEARVAIATRRSDDGLRVEHDPEELIASIREVVESIARRAQTAGRSITAAGLATQRSSLVGWRREDGRALTPVLSWQDRRHALWLKRFESQADWIRERTGLALTAHYGASKMRWCLDELPEVARAATEGSLVMGPLASFILRRLLDSGTDVADPANASRTLLWDIDRRDWSPELLQLFGIPREILPRCVNSRHDYGRILTSTGAIPLTVCTGDQSAAPFAFGPLDPATVYVNVGTGAFVQRVHDYGKAPRLLRSVVWSDADGARYLLEGTVNGAGSALRAWADSAGIDADEVLRGLETQPLPDDPPLYLNTIGGLGSPFWVSDLPARFIGEGDIRAQALAILESIAFLIRVNLEAMRDCGPPPQRLLLTGGIAASNRFCQLLANLSGIPIDRSREAEATASGLARLVAGSRGSRRVPLKDVFIPADEPALQQRYACWLEALRAALDRHG